MKRSTRRRYLQATASVAVAATLAGCPGDGDDRPSPTDETSLTPKVGELETTTTRFVETLSAGEYDASMADFSHTDAMHQQLDAESLEGFWTTQTGSLGQFVEVAGVEYGASQGYHVTVARARFTDGVQLVRVVYDGRSRIAGLQFPGSGADYSPPDYADRSTFTEAERTVPAKNACDLPALLTLPTSEAAGNGPLPGVVLVHGSGPNDMDETVGPNKPLKDLA